MNPGNCCTLRIENTGELGACSMPTDPQLQNKDTNQSVQKKEKRKQHIPALQREWIPAVCLIAIDTAAAGLDVPLARQQFFRNFLRDFDHHIFHIPRVKIPQIDFLHCVPPFRCWELTSDRSGGRRRAAPGLDFGPSWPEAKAKEMRPHSKTLCRRMKLHYHNYTDILYLHSQIVPDGGATRFFSW